MSPLNDPSIPCKHKLGFYPIGNNLWTCRTCNLIAGNEEVLDLIPPLYSQISVKRKLKKDSTFKKRRSLRAKAQFKTKIGEK